MATYAAWRCAELGATCDVLEPWAHGTVARASRYPDFWQFNVLRVAEPPALDVDGLIAAADAALAGLAHRRIDFATLELGAPFREELCARGWRAQPLVRMRFDGERAAEVEGAQISEVDYDAARALRVAWHEEDYPDVPLGGYLESAREVELRRGARVLAAGELGFAQLEVAGDAAEITSVYVRPHARGRGLGTALTSAAIGHAPAVRDLWITADAEGRPQHLYERLGFRAVSHDIEFLRLPA